MGSMNCGHQEPWWFLYITKKNIFIFQQFPEEETEPLTMQTEKEFQVKSFYEDKNHP